MNISIKTNNIMPKLNRMLAPAFFTMGRSMKNCKEEFNDEKFFGNVFVDQKQLKRYNTFFGFSQDLPLSYLYLFAQRAQISLMLDKKFPLSIPGLVQIDNTIKKYDEINSIEQFFINVSVRIPYCADGSIFPSFSVDFIQDDKKVANCISTYIARRTGKKRSVNKNDMPAPVLKALRTEQWFLDKNLGWKYASVSDDYNLIHLFKTFSRMVGFHHPIVQGWYSVSKAVAAMEFDISRELQNICVYFKKPVFLPGSAVFEYLKSKDERVEFNIKDIKGDILVNGFVS